MKMKVFVTGGTGFIGTPLVKILRERGHRVMILSRHGSENRGIIRGDLGRIGKWISRLARFKPDIAIHSAWEGIPDYGIETSIKNFMQSVALIHALGKIKCARFVGIGSCWEYGAKRGKISENIALNPMSPFAAAKISVSMLGREIARSYGMDFIWTRLFYVYGPGQKASSLVPLMLQWKKDGKMPELKNPNGGNDFIYVDDAAEALALIAENAREKYGVYNIGSGKLSGVQEVVQYVYGKKNRLKKPEGFFADIDKIKEEIGWKPATKLEHGINKTIQYFHGKSK